jgi:hypothetical protein
MFLETPLAIAPDRFLEARRRFLEARDAAFATP